MPEDREEWLTAMYTANVIYPPLASPAACSRCLRPLELENRHWGTCYPCGHLHRPTLPQITAVTYGASGTRPWTFFTTTKFEEPTPAELATFVTGIAATLSKAIETQHPEFAIRDGHIVVPLPSGRRLIHKCLAVIEENEWGAITVVDALTAAAGRPRQTGLDEDARRQAANGKYTASEEVAGKHVLLVDDAYTSGFTIHDAARAVSDAGAASVRGLVYARRIYPTAMAIYRAEGGEADGEEG